MGAEVVVLALIVIAGALVLARLLRARLRGETAEMHPLALGFYRGCAFIIILLAAFAWGSIVLGWIVNRQ
jgi:hypothetical protein